MEEIWKDIVGFEGLYQISSLGRVKSLTRKTIDGKQLKEKILKPGIDSKGYYHIILRKDNKSFDKRVHVLVALSFLPNPNNYSDVMHLDESRTNNNVNNLKWGTRKENCNFPLRKERLKQANIGKHIGKNNYFYDIHYNYGENFNSKAVLCEGKYFDSIKRCAEFYNIKYSTMVSWLNGNSNMPTEWKEKDLHYYKSEELNEEQTN